MKTKSIIVLILVVFTVSLIYVEAESDECDTCSMLKQITSALNKIAKNEQPVIYSHGNLIRNRVILAEGATVVEEFLPLPNGQCNVTVAAGPRPSQNSPPPLILIWEAKDANTLNNEKDCGLTFTCSHTVNINDEFSMIKISVNTPGVEQRPNHLSVSYQCIKS